MGRRFAVLLQDTSRPEEAEPLMRRALAIDEFRYGPHHPKVAIRLNNLARLLQDTNPHEEAEPLMRRHLLIFMACSKQGFEHPNLQAAFGNYISLLQAMGLSEDEITAKVQEVIASA
jgi:hypothetical protein